MYDSDECLDETSASCFDASNSQNTTQLLLAQLLSSQSQGSWKQITRHLTVEASSTSLAYCDEVFSDVPAVPVSRATSPLLHRETVATQKSCDNWQEENVTLKCRSVSAEAAQSNTVFRRSDDYATITSDVSVINNSSSATHVSDVPAVEAIVDKITDSNNCPESYSEKTGELCNFTHDENTVAPTDATKDKLDVSSVNTLVFEYEHVSVSSVNDNNIIKPNLNHISHHYDSSNIIIPLEGNQVDEALPVQDSPAPNMLSPSEVHNVTSRHTVGGGDDVDVESHEPSCLEDSVSLGSTTIPCTVSESDSGDRVIPEGKFPDSAKVRVVSSFSVKNVCRFNRQKENLVNVLSQKSDYILEKYLCTLEPPTLEAHPGDAPALSVAASIVGSATTATDVAETKFLDTVPVIVTLPESGPDRARNNSKLITNLLDDWGSLFTSGKNTDVHIKTHAKTIKAHSFVFMVRCSLLYNEIQYNPTNQEQSKEPGFDNKMKYINWINMHADSAELFLRYLYTGTFDHSCGQERLDSVLSLAEKYKCEDLKVFIQNVSKDLNGEGDTNEVSEKTKCLSSPSPVVNTSAESVQMEREECSIAAKEVPDYDLKCVTTSSSTASERSCSLMETSVRELQYDVDDSCTLDLLNPSSPTVVPVSSSQQQDASQLCFSSATFKKSLLYKTNATARSVSPDLFDDDITSASMVECAASPFTIDNDCAANTTNPPMKQTMNRSDSLNISIHPMKETDNCNESRDCISNISSKRNDAASLCNNAVRVVDISQSDESDVSLDTLPDIPDINYHSNSITIETVNNSAVSKNSSNTSAARNLSKQFSVEEYHSSLPKPSDLDIKPTEDEAEDRGAYVSNVWDDFDELGCQEEVVHIPSVSLHLSPEIERINNESVNIVSVNNISFRAPLLRKNTEDHIGLNSTALDTRDGFLHISSSCPNVSRISVGSPSSRRLSRGSNPDGNLAISKQQNLSKNMFSDDTWLHLEQEMARDWDSEQNNLDNEVAANESLRTRLHKKEAANSARGGRRKCTPRRHEASVAGTSPAPRPAGVQRLRQPTTPGQRSPDTSVAITPRPNYETMPSPDLKVSSAVSLLLKHCYFFSMTHPSYIWSDSDFIYAISL